ncbi:pyrimidine dimer DNA glycosylase/endonuclease V [Acidobacteriota bacterium]
MRIWDIPPDKLCRNHLLGEHRELHALWSIITKEKKGYSHHPETLRWKGKLKALYQRHVLLVIEMVRRGYNHKSPLDQTLASGASRQTDYVDSYAKQIAILREKQCDCSMGDLSSGESS